jgi:DNA-binding response OmpR family regulator
VSVGIAAGKSVLVVEDDEGSRMIITKALERQGFQVTLAGDGYDGLHRLETLKPDLIISDLMMPRLDGLAFVRALKERGETKEIPVIIVTARSDTRSMVEGIAAGARFYLTKPFLMRDLVQHVLEALGLASPEAGTGQRAASSSGG